MNRSALFVACLLGALAIALCQGYGETETVMSTGQSQVAIKRASASTVPSLMAYPRSVEETDVTVLSPATPGTDSMSAHGQREYKQSRAYQAFFDRRNKIWGKFWREVNDPRIDQGLEPLPGPEVEPTREERVSMISDFQAEIREIDEAAAQRGYPSQDVVALLVDLRDAGISLGELEFDSYKAIIRLGQAQADYQAKYVEQLLERGCFGTAGYIMSMYVNKIAEALDDPGSMGYTHLNGRITALHVMERSYATASTEEATNAVVANLARQRAKSLPGCGFG